MTGSWMWTRSSGAPGLGGAIVISEPAGALMLVDGVQVGQTPFASAALAAGAHVATLKASGRKEVSREITIAASRVVELRVELPVALCFVVLCCALLCSCALVLLQDATPLNFGR